VDIGFRKRSCSAKKLERDDDSKKSHLALGRAALSLAGFRMILLMIVIWIALRLIFRKKAAAPPAS